MVIARALGADYGRRRPRTPSDAGPLRRGGSASAGRALWLVLFGVYAATLGIARSARPDYGGRRGRTTCSRRVDRLRPRRRPHRRVPRARLRATSTPGACARRPRAPTTGACRARTGSASPLLVAPAYALAGPTGVELLLAAIAALAFVLAAAARAPARARAVGDARRRWSSRLSPPALAYAHAPYRPSCRGRRAARRRRACSPCGRASARAVRTALAAAALLAALPWLGLKFLSRAAIVARRRSCAGCCAAHRRLRRAASAAEVAARLAGDLRHASTTASTAA